jgi:RNA polymerase sigma-70 factor (ECF subfamily)
MASALLKGVPQNNPQKQNAMLYTFDSFTASTAAQSAASDEALMYAVQEKNSDALAELYRRHHLTLRAVIARVLHNDQSVEDLLQEVFMEVWKVAARYSAEKGKALGWMITLARRRAIDRLRREQAYFRVEEKYQKATERQPEAWTQHDGGEEVEFSDLKRMLLAIVRGLPDAQRVAVELCFFEGLSQREVAVRTSVPLGTIKTRLELALRKIASRFRELTGEIASPALIH